MSCTTDPGGDVGDTGDTSGNTTTETGAEDPCACIPQSTLQACGDPTCSKLDGYIDHDSGSDIIAQGDYECAIQALLDRTPGPLIYDLSDIGGDFSSGFILIQEDGTILAGMWHDQETIDVEYGLPRSDAHYENCLNATSFSPMLACLRDPIGDVLGTCEP
jgi:hypothetical protein